MSRLLTLESDGSFVEVKLRHASLTLSALTWLDVCADLRRSDTGDYQCWAASETGLTRSHAARLTVDAPSSGAVVFHRSPKPNTFPAPPGRPSVGDVTNTTVRLAWRAPGNVGTSPLLGYVIEYFSHLIGQVLATY